MKPSGAHTHPEMGGGGGGNRWLVILGAIVLVAIARPVAHAIHDLIMVLIITVVLLAVAGTAALLTHRVRCRGARALTRRACPLCRPPNIGRWDEPKRYTSTSTE
jgi:hypothetical protein